MCQEWDVEGQLANGTAVSQFIPRGSWRQLSRLWVLLSPESPVGIFKWCHLTLVLLESRPRDARSQPYALC